MSNLSRRTFNTLLGGASMMSLAAPNIAFGAKPKAVIIGGGAGGATAARYIAKDSNGEIEVTLVEPNKRYYTCFFSNLYLGGLRDFASLGHGYDRLVTQHGINVIHDWAIGVDGAAKTVTLGSGVELPYDRLVLSPGIDMKYDSLPGYSIAAQSRAPHGWKSGTQVQIIKAQVEGLREGGTFIMVPPPDPSRCPPGPYERVSMMAHILKQTNPSARIIILDTKPKFSKQGLFSEGWEIHYPGMIEWIGPDIHGGILNVNTDDMSVKTDFDTFKADAMSIIPAQKAGAIAMRAGVTDGDWAPIVPATMQAKADNNIYVLGDASAASEMPKSGFSANSQAKVAANHIHAELTGSRLFEPRFINTCWSLIAPDDGVKVGARYKAGTEKIESIESFISQPDESADTRRATYQESESWYAAMTDDLFG